MGVPARPGGQRPISEFHIPHSTSHILLSSLLLSAAPALADKIPPIPAIPSLLVHAPHLSGSMTQGKMSGTANDPVKIVYGGELSVQAQTITADRANDTYTASGDPILKELTAYLAARSIELHQGSLATGGPWGIANEAAFVRPPFLIKAKSIRLSEGQVVGEDGYFTTAPPNVSPAYSIRGETVTLNTHTGTADIKNASVYLFGTRIINLRHYKLVYASSGAGGGRGPVNRPQAGVNSRYGVFGSYHAPAGTWLPVDIYFLLPQKNSPQLRLEGSQAIRFRHRSDTSDKVFVVGDPGKVDAPWPAMPDSPASAPQTRVKPGSPPEAKKKSILEMARSLALGNQPLPDGDPLLFAQLIPWPETVKPLDAHPGGGLAAVEQLSAHIASSGNDRNDLYVSRLPELGFTGLLPLTRVTSRPSGDDPDEFRHYLHKIVLYAGGSVIAGKYLEQPDNIRHDRSQYNAWLNTSPFLIGRNTVLFPKLVYTYNHYNASRDGYRYAQAAISTMHYVSDRTGFGVDYSISAVGGNSPFNFDVLDAAQELDARAQIGNQNLVVGGVVRTDVEHGRVFDYRITVAPTFRGLVTVFTYDFQNKDIGCDFRVQGVNL